MKPLSRSADISMNVLFATFIAVISIVLLIAVFPTKFTTFTKTMYCHTFSFILTNEHVPQGIRADPQFCKIEYALETADIGYPDCMLREDVLVHLIDCWEQVAYGNFSRNYLCKKLVVSRRCNATAATEQDITQLIKEQRLCDVLPNKDYLNCGDENKIDWRITLITPQNNILIEFDNASKMMKVS